MACQRFSALPSASSTLTGREIVPLTNASNVDQKTTTGAVAISATEYDATLTYTTGYQVLATDGNIYRALQNALGQTPQTSPLYWKLILVNASTTLAVPSVHATIIAAMTYLNEAVINSAVNIQVADGAYNYTTTQINLSHPYGRLISITGNIATPASCSLSFSALPSPPSSPYLNADSGSLYAAAPSGVTINGFSILKSGGAPAFGHNGILASNGAVINVGTNMIINGFYADMAALDGGFINATGVELVTASTFYALLADNGILNAPSSVITGAGDAVATYRNGFVRMNNSTIDAAIGTAVTMVDGTVELTSTTIGNVDIFYEIQGSVNVINDSGVTYGTAGVYDIGLNGTMNYNGAIIVADAVTFARSLINPNTIQKFITSTTKTYFSTTGINTAAMDLVLSADGADGIIIDTAAGDVSIPTSLTLGATPLFTGIISDRDVLDLGDGSALILAPWLTANTVIVCSSADDLMTGQVFAEPSEFVVGVSFVIRSTAGAADEGALAAWIAMVYP